MAARKIERLRVAALRQRRLIVLQRLQVIALRRPAASMAEVAARAVEMRDYIIGEKMP